MDTKEWLAKRRLTIGSSDAAAVCGLDPFDRTATDIWLDKVQSIDQPENPQMRWGKRLEPVIADAYTEATGLKLHAPDGILYTERYPFMHATLDRVAEDGRVVELKTSRFHHEWGPLAEDIPEGYLIQVHHQMIVADATRADLAVLIGGNDFRIYPVPFNRRLAQLLIEQEEAFYAHMQSRTPPPPDWDDERTLAALDRLYSPIDTERILLDRNVTILVDEYLHLKEQVNAAKVEIDLLKGRLIGVMGHAGVGELPDGRLLIRKTVTRHYGAREAYESSHNEFRIKLPRKAKS
jgi:putative phage-type endonuclease